MQNIFVHHMLSCPNCGRVITHHNDICDDIIHLAKKNLPPNCVHGETLIYQGRRIP